MINPGLKRKKVIRQEKFAAPGAGFSAKTIFELGTDFPSAQRDY